MKNGNKNGTPKKSISVCCTDLIVPIPFRLLLTFFNVPLLIIYLYIVFIHYGTKYYYVYFLVFLIAYLLFTLLVYSTLISISPSRYALNSLSRSIILSRIFFPLSVSLTITLNASVSTISELDSISLFSLKAS